MGMRFKGCKVMNNRVKWGFVKLNYLELNRKKRKNMIWVHGLFGDHKNFIDIANNELISDEVNSYIVDLRNHRYSDRSSSMKI